MEGTTEPIIKADKARSAEEYIFLFICCADISDRVAGLTGRPSVACTRSPSFTNDSLEISGLHPLPTILPARY